MGWYRFCSRAATVLFPDPLGPTSAVTSPGRRVKVSPWRPEHQSHGKRPTEATNPEAVTVSLHSTMSYPREETRKMGRYSHASPPTCRDLCSLGVITPRGVEMEGEAKTERKTRHLYATYLVSDTMRKQKKITFKSTKGKKEESWEAGAQISLAIPWDVRDSSLRASSPILLGNPNWFFSLGQFYGTDGAHFCL